MCLCWYFWKKIKHSLTDNQVYPSTDEQTNNIVSHNNILEIEELLYNIAACLPWQEYQALRLTSKKLKASLSSIRFIMHLCSSESLTNREDKVHLILAALSHEEKNLISTPEINKQTKKEAKKLIKLIYPLLTVNLKTIIREITEKHRGFYDASHINTTNSQTQLSFGWTLIFQKLCAILNPSHLQSATNSINLAPTNNPHPFINTILTESRENDEKEYLSSSCQWTILALSIMGSPLLFCGGIGTLCGTMTMYFLFPQSVQRALGESFIGIILTTALPLIISIVILAYTCKEYSHKLYQNFKSRQLIGVSPHTNIIAKFLELINLSAEEIRAFNKTLPPYTLSNNTCTFFPQNPQELPSPQQSPSPLEEVIVIK